METRPQHSADRRDQLLFGKYDYPLSRYNEGAQVVVNTGIPGREWQVARIVQGNAEVDQDGRLRMTVNYPGDRGPVREEKVFTAAEAPRVVEFPGVGAGDVRLIEDNQKREDIILRQDSLHVTNDGRIEYDITREMVDDSGTIHEENIVGVPQELLLAYRDLINTHNEFNTLAGRITHDVLPAHRAKLREVRLDIVKMLREVYGQLPHVGKMATADKEAVAALKVKLDTQVSEAREVMQQLASGITHAEGEARQHEEGVDEVVYNPETPREILERLRFARDYKKAVNEAVGRHKVDLDEKRRLMVEEHDRELKKKRAEAKKKNEDTSKEFAQKLADWEADKQKWDSEQDQRRRKAKPIEDALRILSSKETSANMAWSDYNRDYSKFYGAQPPRPERPPRGAAPPLADLPPRDPPITQGQLDILQRERDLISAREKAQDKAQARYDELSDELADIPDREVPLRPSNPILEEEKDVLDPVEEAKYLDDLHKIDEELKTQEDKAVFEIIQALQKKVADGTANAQEKALVEELEHQRLAQAAGASGPDMVGVDAAGKTVKKGKTPDHFDYKGDGPVIFATPRAQKNKELLGHILDEWETAAEPIRAEVVDKEAEVFDWDKQVDELIQAAAKAMDDMKKNGNISLPRYRDAYNRLRTVKDNFEGRKKWWSSPAKAIKDQSAELFTVGAAMGLTDIDEINAATPAQKKELLSELRVSGLINGWNELSALEQVVAEATGHSDQQKEGNKEDYDQEHLNIDSRTLQEILGPQVNAVENMWRAILMDEDGIEKLTGDERGNVSVSEERILNSFREMIPAEEPAGVDREVLRRAGIKDWRQFKEAWDKKFARQYAVEMYKVVQTSLKRDMAHLVTVLQRLGANREATLVQSAVTMLAVGGTALAFSGTIGKLAGVFGAMGGPMLARVSQMMAGGMGGALGGLIKTFVNEKVGMKVEAQKHAYHNNTPDKRGKSQLFDIGGRAAHHTEEMEDHAREEFVDRYVGAMFGNPNDDQVTDGTSRLRFRNPFTRTGGGFSLRSPFERRATGWRESATAMSGGLVVTSEILSQLMRTERGNARKAKLMEAGFGEEVQALTGAQVVELEGILERAERTEVDEQVRQKLVHTLVEMRGGTDMMVLRMYGEHPHEVHTLSEANRNRYIEILSRVGNLDIGEAYKKAIVDFILGKPLTEKLKTPEGEEQPKAYTVDELLKQIRGEVGSDAGKVEMIEKYLAMYAGKVSTGDKQSAVKVNAAAGFALAAGRFGGTVFGAAMMGKVGWETGERMFLQSERDRARRSLNERMQQLREARDEIEEIMNDPTRHHELEEARETATELMRVLHGTGSEEDMIAIFEFQTVIERDGHGHIKYDKNGKPFRKAVPFVDLTTLTELQSILHEVRDAGLFMEDRRHRQSLTSALQAMEHLSEEVQEKSRVDQEEWIRLWRLSITHGERRELKRKLYKLAGGAVGSAIGGALGFGMGWLTREFISLQHDTFGGEIPAGKNLADIDIHDMPTTPEAFAKWLHEHHPDLPPDIRPEDLAAAHSGRRGLDEVPTGTPTTPEVGPHGSALDTFAASHDLGPHGKDVLQDLVNRYPELNNEHDLQAILNASRNTSGHVETTLATRDMAVAKCLLDHGNRAHAADFVDNYVNSHGLGDQKIAAAGGIDKVLDNITNGAAPKKTLAIFHAIEGTNLQQGQGELPGDVDAGNFGVKGVAYKGGHDIAAGAGKNDVVLGIHEHELATGSGKQILFTHAAPEVHATAEVAPALKTTSIGGHDYYLGGQGRLANGDTVLLAYGPDGNLAKVLNTANGASAEWIDVPAKLPASLKDVAHIDIPKVAGGTAGAAGVAESARSFGGGGGAAREAAGAVTTATAEVPGTSLGKIGNVDIVLGKGVNQSQAEIIMRGLRAEHDAAEQLFRQHAEDRMAVPARGLVDDVDRRIAEFAAAAKAGKPLGSFTPDTRSPAEIAATYNDGLTKGELVRQAGDIADKIGTSLPGQEAAATVTPEAAPTPGVNVFEQAHDQLVDRLTSFETGVGGKGLVKDVLHDFDLWKAAHPDVKDPAQALREFEGSLGGEKGIFFKTLRTGGVEVSGHTVRANIDGQDYVLRNNGYTYFKGEHGELMAQRGDGTPFEVKPGLDEGGNFVVKRK